MKRWFAFLLMFILAVALVGCDNKNGNGEKKEPSTYTITYNLNGVHYQEQKQNSQEMNYQSLFQHQQKTMQSF